MRPTHREHRVRFPDNPPGRCQHCDLPCQATRRAHPECASTFTRERDYRGAMVADHAADDRPLTCIDSGRPGATACSGPVQADHVVGLYRHGPRDWTVPRCAAHHQDKTNRERAAHPPRRTRPVTATSTGKARPKTPKRRGGGGGGGMDDNTVLALAVIAVIAVAGGVLDGPRDAAIAAWTSTRAWLETPTRAATAPPAGMPEWAGAAAALAAVAAITVAAVAAVRWLRRRVAEEVRTGIARHTRTDPQYVRVRLRGAVRPATRGAARYDGGTCDDAPGSRDRVAVEEFVTRRAGRPLTFTWATHRSRIAWRPGRGAATAAASPDDATAPHREDAVAASHRLLQSTLEIEAKGDVTLTFDECDDQGPRTFRVQYPASLRDHSDDVRATVQAAIDSKLHAYGRYSYDWNRGSNVLTGTRRPPMPAAIDLPPAPEGAPWAPIPLGVDEAHEDTPWDPRIDPHMLVVGTTGGGKTVTISGVIVGCLARHWEVIIIDGKGISLSGFAGMPGVVRSGFGDAADMAAAMDYASALVQRRNRQYRTHGTEPEEFTPTLVVLDEAAEFADNVADWWKNEGKAQAESKSTNAPALTAWKSVARLGREARVHMVVGVQQGAASVFGGTATRDQLPARVGMGPLTEEGARMAFGRADVGRDLPPEVKGRATVRLSGRYTEVQCYRTPTPKANGDVRDEDRALLSRLLPGIVLPPDEHAAAQRPEPAPPRVTEDPPGDPAAPPATEPTRPQDLARGDTILGDDDRVRVVLDVDPDEDSDDVILRLREPDGTESGEEVWDRSEMARRITGDGSPR